MSALGELAGMMAALAVTAAAETTELDPVTVTGRDLDPGAPRSTTRLTEAELEPVRPTHPSEVFARIPGTWVTRGSGQEHLSAVRSPLLPGAGGCGALLILEEGVPIRPPGFCNVNNLFEVNLLQAESVSVLRGPGGIGHASGGLHGVIDVRTRPPLALPAAIVRAELGSDAFRRLELSAAADLDRHGRLRADASFTDAGSFRDQEGYDHQFLTLHHQAEWAGAALSTILSSALLDQDTAGFITGENAFRNPGRRTDNDNPEAFRRGSAVRLVSRADWQGEGGLTRLTGFARRSRMTFLQHFLPGQPLERNGQVSAGLQLDRVRPMNGFELQWGLDFEVFNGFLFEDQDSPATAPPPVAAIRPVGRHYDYEVDGQRLGGYLAGDWELSRDWRLRAGLHGDFIRYDYATRLMPGNLAEDGSACQFGGCLFNRPADRVDRFANLAPELTLTRSFDGGIAWARLARGFRAPQATELYRLQRGQDVADLDSEVLDAAELGVRGGGAGSWWELVGFHQQKRNFIFRDAEGFNVSDGRADHTGIEFSGGQALTRTLTASARGTVARHRYRFDRDLGGETIVNGNVIPSAPRRLFSADLSWRPDPDWLAQLAFESTGRYYLDAQNERRYGGHRLWHLYLRHRIDGGWTASLRARNLLDRRYAERADFAFGNFRYFPGPGRSLFVALGREF